MKKFFSWIFNFIKSKFQNPFFTDRNQSLKVMEEQIVNSILLSPINGVCLDGDEIYALLKNVNHSVKSKLTERNNKMKIEYEKNIFAIKNI